MCYLKAHLKNFAGLVPIAVSSQVGSATARSSKLQGSVALRRKGSHLRFGLLVRGRRCVLSAIGNMENAASAAGSSHVPFSLTGVKEWFQIPTSTPTVLRVVQISSCGPVSAVVSVVQFSSCFKFRNLHRCDDNALRFPRYNQNQYPYFQSYTP
jgi:hypothetical protein